MNFDKLRTITLKEINSLEECFKHWEVECPVIPKLFSEDYSRSLYNLFGVSIESFEGVENLAHSLHHAFLDDGDYHIKATPNEDMYKFREGLSERHEKIEPPVMDYTYSLEGGDCITNIWEEELSLLIDVDRLHYDYYKVFGKEVEKREDANVVGWKRALGGSAESKEYFRLAKLRNNMLGEMHKNKSEWNIIGGKSLEEMKVEEGRVMEFYQEEVDRVREVIEGKENKV